MKRRSRQDRTIPFVPHSMPTFDVRHHDHETRKMKSPAFIATTFTIVIGMVILMSISEPVLGAFIFVPFALGPLFVSLIVAAFSSCRSCQATLILGSVLYAAWFTFVYLSAFHWHPDAQSGIALLFIGVYSLPVMIPIWVVTLALRRRNRINSEPDAGWNPARTSQDPTA